jgi:hypothetical protein
VVLIFLDVDGTLLPFVGSSRPQFPGAGENPLIEQIDLEQGRRLAALPAELIWATTWMDEANESLGPCLGWPRLSVLEAAEPSAVDEYFGLHWKTRPIIDRAGGQAFAWVDDEITDADQEWVSEHHPGLALLLRVDPHVGLAAADFALLTTWVLARARSES